MKYLKNRSLAVAARSGVPLRSDFLDSLALQRIYHFYVAHPSVLPRLTPGRNEVKV